MFLYLCAYKKYDRSTRGTEVQLSMAVFQRLKSLLANVFAYLGIFESPQMSPRIRIHGTSDGVAVSSIPEEMSPLP